MVQSKKELSVFLDASVLVAAALSPAGGSFRILSELPLRGFRYVTSQHTFGEAENAIMRKYPDRNIELHHLAIFLDFVHDASDIFAVRLADIIDPKDAPVLAAALKSNVDILVTLDRKHFLENPKLRKKYHRLEIMTPGDFIGKYFL